MTDTEPPTFADLAAQEDVPQELVDANPSLYARRSAILGAVVLEEYGERIGFDTDETLLADLLADLRHAADAAGVSFEGALSAANARYAEEAAA